MAEHSNSERFHLCCLFSFMLLITGPTLPYFSNKVIETNVPDTMHIICSTYVVQRNLFLVGFITMIFSLPHMAAMVCLYFKSS